MSKYIIDSKSNITINIATGESRNLIDLINIIENCLHKKAKIDFLIEKEMQFDLRFDIKKLKQYIPDFVPEVMEKGIIRNIKEKTS